MAKSVKHLFAWRLVLLASAGALIAAGLCQSEAMVVLQKAVKICFECIGLG